MILDTPDRVAAYTQRGWWGQRTLIDLFLDNVERSADALAVVDPPNRAALAPGEPRRLTYAELLTATDRLAHALLASGVGKDVPEAELVVRGERIQINGLTHQSDSLFESPMLRHQVPVIVDGISKEGIQF